MDVFVYGTLCWDALLWRVSGRDDLTVVPAQLPGHRTHWAAGQAFPMIAPVAGASAPGLLVLDVDPSVLERLDHYEGGFDYQLQSRPVVCQDQTVDAQVYIPPAEIAPGDLWDLAAWRNTHGALAFEAAIEVMARLGQDAPKQMAAKYPMMQVRASQRLAAQAQPSPPSPSGMSVRDVSETDFRMPYSNFFAMAEVDVRVARFDQDGSGERDAYGPVTRAAFVGTDAAIVLPYDPVRDRVLLIEQFRPGPYLRSDAHPWMMEPIAGRVDANEAAETTAHREAMEESGLTLNALHLVHSGYPSPGCSTEYFHVYVGIADLSDDVARIGGLETEQEDIKGHILDWADFDAGLNAGQYPVVPLALAGHWLARNRDNLRHDA